MSEDLEPSTTFAGEPGTLGKDGRLQIPVEVRRAVRWLAGTKPVRLTVELVSPGLARVYPTDAVAARIQGVRRRVSTEHPGSLEHLAALSDRYRAVSYYPSDSRIHFSQATAVYLRSDEREATYYVEARGDHILVMSLRLRAERLERLASELELGVDTADD
jgi:hypothetical protein